MHAKLAGYLLPPRLNNMAKQTGRHGVEPWDPAVCLALIDQLWTVRRSMLANAERLTPWMKGLDASRVPSAINLAHYLALRQVDFRPLQAQLSWLGISSLGRSETHVLGRLGDTVITGVFRERISARPGEQIQVSIDPIATPLRSRTVPAFS